jgi:hypothetical protein
MTDCMSRLSARAVGSRVYSGIGVKVAVFGISVKVGKRRIASIVAVSAGARVDKGISVGSGDSCRVQAVVPSRSGRKKSKKRKGDIISLLIKEYCTEAMPA